jgi:hypothetical protein
VFVASQTQGSPAACRVIASSAAGSSSIAGGPVCRCWSRRPVPRGTHLPHAAGSSCGRLRLAVEPDQRQQHSALRRSTADAGRLQGQLHVAARREPQQQRRLLEHERRRRAQVDWPAVSSSGLRRG